MGFAQRSRSGAQVFYEGWCYGIFANALISIEKVRLHVGDPTVPYALAVRIAKGAGNNVHLQLLSSDRTEGRCCDIKSMIVLPPYEIGSFSSFDAAINLFSRDLLNSVGVDIERILAVNWSEYTKSEQ
jgi:hypothetical protein